MCKKQINKKMSKYHNSDKNLKRAMKKAESSLVYTEKLSENSSAYGVYLDYGGSQKYLATHKGGLLFDFLKGGKSLSQLRRWSPSGHKRNPRRRARNSELEQTISHLVEVIDLELEQIIEGKADTYTIELYTHRSFTHDKLDRNLAA